MNLILLNLLIRYLFCFFSQSFFLKLQILTKLSIRSISIFFGYIQNPRHPGCRMIDLYIDCSANWEAVAFARHLPVCRRPVLYVSRQTRRGFDKLQTELSFTAGWARWYRITPKLSVYLIAISCLFYFKHCSKETKTRPRQEQLRHEIYDHSGLGSQN